MALYIGGKSRHKNHRLAQSVMLVLLVIAAGCAFGYFNYIWPQLAQNDAIKKIARYDELASAGCDSGNEYCLERLTKAANGVRNSAFAKALDSALETDEIKKHLTKAHTDGTICFLVDSDKGDAPSEAELTTWLEDYGSKDFMKDTALIKRMRNSYEAKYLKPSPRIYQIELFRSLRWRHIPFGQTWRDYTLASRFLEWSAIVEGPTPPQALSQKEKRLMRAIEKNPSYFTDANIERLENLAKRKLTLDRLTAVRDAIKQYRRDVHDIPVGSDRSKLELGWLVSNDDIHPWNKKRWRGPYVSEKTLVDMWGCPIVGERKPQTGAMELTARGSDCADGGEGDAEDIALTVSAYVPIEEKPEDTEDTAKTKKRLKRRRSSFSIFP
jgi:hypothetical protein